jgi:D-sedoheptulose 7-phosphate isomerase
VKRKSFGDIADALDEIEVVSHGYEQIINLLKMSRYGGSKVFFIGNGGSAAIASHMAADWMKNGGFPALCFNDGAALTCLSNDLGYEHVFDVPLNRFGHIGDILFAISSSGESKSITNAAMTAKTLRMNVVTLSGFGPRNTLRSMGGINFYVPSKSYGTVEVVHLAILHSLLDEVMAS